MIERFLDRLSNLPRWRMLTGCFAVLFAVYWLSPQHIAQVDSVYSIHTSVSFLQGKWGSLEDYPIRPNEQVVYVDGKPYNFHPPGVSLISMPIVLLGIHLIPSLLPKLAAGHSKFEYMVSSFWAAVLGAVFLNFLLTHFRDRKAALITAMLFAFCSSVWSLAAMALWQHGPLMLMHAITLDLLYRAERDQRYAKFIAIPLALAFLIRPTAAIPIAVFTLYVLVRHRRHALGYFLFAAAIAIPWFAYNFSIYGAPLPASYVGRGWGFEFALWPEGLAGTLISPARGLLIYSPILLFSLPGLIIALRTTAFRALHWCIVAIVVAHWLVVSMWVNWFGGYCYGPRMMTDVLPFFFLYVAYYVEHLRTDTGRRVRAWRWVFGTLTAWSFFVHAQGALLERPSQWDNHPVELADALDRLWAWDDPPYLRFPRQTWPFAP